MAAKIDYMLVAAIDFGTTFSGYAFSFVPSENEPKLHETIRINSNWLATLGFQVSIDLQSTHTKYTCMYMYLVMSMHELL